ncbi:MAG: hypothetical protein ACXVA3_11455 [Vulcanimicrobiaceae bacterium]
MVHHPCEVVAAGLPQLFPHHLRVEQDGGIRIDLPPHAVAELAADPINSERLSPGEESWYPAFTGTIALHTVHDDRTDVTITGTLEHGTAALRNAHYEREVAQKALEHLLHLMQRHFARSR